MEWIKNNSVGFIAIAVTLLMFFSGKTANEGGYYNKIENNSTQIELLSTKVDSLTTLPIQMALLKESEHQYRETIQVQLREVTSYNKAVITLTGQLNFFIDRLDEITLDLSEKDTRINTINTTAALTKQGIDSIKSTVNKIENSMKVGFKEQSKNINHINMQMERVDERLHNVENKLE